MKNRVTVLHGMLPDLKEYLEKSGWKLEPPVGEYEALRARCLGYPRPLLIHDRASGGCGYSIDERDSKIYQGWKKSRSRRGLNSQHPTAEESKKYWEGLKSETL